MPEVSRFVLWSEVDWHNVDEGTPKGGIDRRPYYYKINNTSEGIRLVIISAPDRGAPLRATDFLQLDRQSFRELMRIANTAFGL